MTKNCSGGILGPFHDFWRFLPSGRGYASFQPPCPPLCSSVAHREA